MCVSGDSPSQLELGCLTLFWHSKILPNSLLCDGDLMNVQLARVEDG